MSIWSTFWAAGDDGHANDCGRWKPLGKTAPHEWAFELDNSLPCTCGQPGAPYAYQGSHVLPSEDNPRGGYVGLAAVESHVTRDGRDDQPEDGVPWPWLRLRLSAGQEDAVLDEAQARQLRDALDGWLRARAGES